MGATFHSRIYTKRVAMSPRRRCLMSQARTHTWRRPARLQRRVAARKRALFSSRWQWSPGQRTRPRHVEGPHRRRANYRSCARSRDQPFDVADIHGNGHAEVLIGEVLSGVPRHRYVLSSKVYFPVSDDVKDRGLSRKHIFEALDRSLRRLKANYLDIYFCHRWDRDTPLEETLRAMDDLCRQGKLLYWGTSQWDPNQVRRRPICEQAQFNLLCRIASR